MMLERDRIRGYAVLLLMVVIFLVPTFTFVNAETSDPLAHVELSPVDPDLTSPSGTYRWLDVADQVYGSDYRDSYNYSQATVEVTYEQVGEFLNGTLIASNLKPNFAYQLKLVGTPGTDDNERIGLAGRWWQEVWDGSAWSDGWNLNNKGDGSSPNPNDVIYFERRYQEDSNSPTGYHYRYTGYLPFEYFITDSNGEASLDFETGSCYHVLWKTSQRSHDADDGPITTVIFDPDPLETAYYEDYPSNTVSVFGEWERLPMGGVHLLPGEYSCQIVLTEESFHSSGGEYAGNWAGAMSAEITFTIMNTPSRSIVYDDETNTITVTGGTEGNPIDFWDLWNASNVNGWGVVHNNNESDTQFQFDSSIHFGDGSLATYFADEGVTVLFGSEISTNIMRAKRYANVRFGKLKDATDKTTANGVHFIVDGGNTWFYDENTGYRQDITSYFYSSSFYSSDGEKGLVWIQGGNDRIWNCIFLKGFKSAAYFDGDIYNLINQDSASYALDAIITGAELERLVITHASTSAILQWSTNVFTVKDVIARNNAKLFSFASASGNSYAINVDADSWNFNWWGPSSTKLYRQYTFNLLVVNSTGFPLNNANCTLYRDDDTQAFSVLTGADGTIAEQTVSRGFYNQTGGNTLYDYGPFKLTVVKGAMSEIIANISLSDPEDWTVSLEEAGGGVPSTIGLALAVFSPVVGMAVVLTTKRARAWLRLEIWRST